jgi:biopolymer transport protein ExbD
MHGGGGTSEADPNLTPLLDVVLQLIMFFMITVNFVSTEHLNRDIRLPVAQALVPKDKEDEEREKQKDKIDGYIYVNLNAKNEIVGIRDLDNRDREGNVMQTRERIKAYFQGEMDQYQRKARLDGRQAKVILVLRGDKDSRFHKVFDILEAGRLAGIEDYQLRGMTQFEKKK